MTNELTKILCVDDDSGVLEALTRTLRKRFNVLTASSTDEAFAIVAAHPDLAVVISDQIMGPMTGVEFLAKVYNKLPQTSRVLLSGQVDIKSMEEAINTAKIHKFIMKPWENEHLILQIVEAVKNHRMIVEKDRLHTLSITDPITQLTNHRFFQERIRIEWDKHREKKNQLSLIMVDIDHFKRYNDQFGHPEGDKVLTKVAARLQQELSLKTSISRYGGEEFAIILPDTSAVAAYKTAERLRQAIAQETFGNYPLSISLGIATAPEHADSVNELIISADQSLYQAKRRGRNQTVVGLPLEH